MDGGRAIGWPRQLATSSKTTRGNCKPLGHAKKFGRHSFTHPGRGFRLVAGFGTVGRSYVSTTWPQLLLPEIALFVIQARILELSHGNADTTGGRTGRTGPPTRFANVAATKLQAAARA